MDLALESMPPVSQALSIVWTAVRFHLTSIAKNSIWHRLDLCILSLGSLLHDFEGEKFFSFAIFSSFNDYLNSNAKVFFDTNIGFMTHCNDEDFVLIITAVWVNQYQTPPCFHTIIALTSSSHDHLDVVCLG